uniref:Uncharacterized protein n=1 Tax=Arundo donax TaxID=35708 RepID=A0A0A9CQC5_ARUDO
MSCTTNEPVSIQFNKLFSLFQTIVILITSLCGLCSRANRN